MLIIIKTTLYEAAVALCASMIFWKGLGKSKPWGDSQRSRWGRRLWRQEAESITSQKKKYKGDLLYEKPYTETHSRMELRLH